MVTAIVTKATRLLLANGRTRDSTTRTAAGMHLPRRHRTARPCSIQEGTITVSATPTQGHSNRPPAVTPARLHRNSRVHGSPCPAGVQKLDLWHEQAARVSLGQRGATARHVARRGDDARGASAPRTPLPVSPAPQRQPPSATAPHRRLRSGASAHLRCHTRLSPPCWHARWCPAGGGHAALPVAGNLVLLLQQPAVSGRARTPRQ